MIDNFSILLAHGLLLLTAWRLMARPDLDREVSDQPEKAVSPWGKPDGP